MNKATDNILFAFLQENPTAVAGAATFLVAFALVAGNAFYSQSGAHPDPIWATRDMTNTHSISQDGFNPPVRKVSTRLIRPRTIPVPESRSAALLNSTRDGGASAVVPTWDRETVRQVQAALAETGHFKGEVDGLYGPVTKAAIIEFQRQNGLKQTGIPDMALAEYAGSSAPKAVATNRNASTLDGIIEKATAEIEPGVRPAYDRELVVKVQTALAKTGESEIDVDGIFGSQTEEAIRRFQEKHHLTVDGIPGPQFLRKLADVGVLSEV